MIMVARVRSHPELRLVIDTVPTYVGGRVYRSRIIYRREIDTYTTRDRLGRLIHKTLPMRSARLDPMGLGQLIGAAINDMEEAEHG